LLPHGRRRGLRRRRRWGRAQGLRITVQEYEVDVPPTLAAGPFQTRLPSGVRPGGEEDLRFIKVTAGVVASAAIVIVFVFAVFGTLKILFLKEFGVGLAAAILIDATIVRAVLLPATMKLLGDWNWYLPSWLEWLPHIGYEREEAPEVPAARPT
jgi:MMPL family